MKPKKIKAYMDMARAITQLSPDTQTKVGAVLISKTGRQIASGYNGFLRGAPDDELPTTRPEKYEFMQHAERNILYNCLDEGIQTRHCTIITTLSPCAECLRACFQAGVKKIIYKDLYKNAVDYENMADLRVFKKEIEHEGEKYYILSLMPEENYRRIGVYI